MRSPRSFGLVNTAVFLQNESSIPHLGAEDSEGLPDSRPTGTGDGIPLQEVEHVGGGSSQHRQWVCRCAGPCADRSRRAMSENEGYELARCLPHRYLVSLAVLAEVLPAGQPKWQMVWMGRSVSGNPQKGRRCHVTSHISGPGRRTKGAVTSCRVSGEQWQHSIVLHARRGTRGNEGNTLKELPKRLHRLHRVASRGEVRYEWRSQGTEGDTRRGW